MKTEKSDEDIFHTRRLAVSSIAVGFDLATGMPNSLSISFVDGTAGRTVVFEDPKFLDYYELRIPQLASVVVTQTSQRGWEQEARFEVVEASDEPTTLFWARTARLRD